MFISWFAVVCVTVSQVQLMDFAQRMRVERITGSVSVYSSEPFSGNLAVSPQYISSRCLGDILTGLHDTYNSASCKYLSIYHIICIWPHFHYMWQETQFVILILYISRAVDTHKWIFNNRFQMSTYRRLLQYVLAIFYTNPQGVLIYKGCTNIVYME